MLESESKAEQAMTKDAQAAQEVQTTEGQLSTTQGQLQITKEKRDKVAGTWLSETVCACQLSLMIFSSLVAPSVPEAIQLMAGGHKMFQAVRKASIQHHTRFCCLLAVSMPGRTSS